MANDDGPRLKDMKPLTSKEVERLVKGGEHPHELKIGYGGSKADLFKDKKGDIYIGRKGGTDEPTDTRLNVKKF